MVLRGIFYFTLWLLLCHWDQSSLIVGIPVIAVALLVGSTGRREKLPRISILRLPAFTIFFVVESIRGGIDVAKRAWGKSAGITGGWTTYHTSLPPGNAEVFFTGLIGLLPGTMTVEIDGGELCIHVLDKQSFDPENLQRVEQQVAALFSIK